MFYEGVRGERRCRSCIEVVIVVAVTAIFFLSRKERIQLDRPITEADKDSLRPWLGEGEVGCRRKSGGRNAKTEAAVACERAVAVVIVVLSWFEKICWQNVTENGLGGC